MTTQPEELDARAKLLAFAAEHRLSMDVEFIPYSRSDNAKPRADHGGKPWPSLNWRIKLSIGEGTPLRGVPGKREILETSYAAGIGHAPAMKRADDSAVIRGAPYTPKRARDELAAWEIENGYPGKFSVLSNGNPSRLPGAEAIMPDLCDVLASLALDAGALDAGSFEDWASEYGYDTDSRKAEAAYRACLEIALKLRAALGDDGLTALREAAQDY